MIVPNLNPGQKPLRPTSASLRTPRGGGDQSTSRPQKADGQATPRLRPTHEHMPTSEIEEPWLFSFERPLNTGDVWRMGFSRLLVLSAQTWTNEEVAAGEICEAFRSREIIQGMSAEHKSSMEAVVAPSFLKGDTLISVRCDQCYTLPPEELRRSINCVAKLVDCVSNVWMQYDEMADPDLGAVVMVLEGEPRPP